MNYQILIILWCLHFGCCTGKENEANGSIERENFKLVSKLYGNLVPRVSHLTVLWGERGETLGTRLL